MPANANNDIQYTLCQSTRNFIKGIILDGSRSRKVECARFSNDVSPETVFQLLTEQWRLGPPKIAISVHGDLDFVSLHLKSIIKEGLVRTTKDNEIWILTKATNTCHLDEILRLTPNSNVEGGQISIISMATWDGKIMQRRNFEKYLSFRRLPGNTTCYLPLICLVVAGGVDTITTIHDYVKHSPPIPVVVLAGSGQSSDLITCAHEYSMMTMGSDETEKKRQKLLRHIKNTFEYDGTEADYLLAKMLECVENKNLITVFRPDESIALDHVLLKALFRARQLAKKEQLDLALAWNRFDVVGLEDEFAMQALIETLVANQVDVVKLLLDNGLPLRKLLTKSWLEKLYKKEPCSSLRFVISDPCMRKSFSMKDVDVTINKYMGGGAYCSKYFVKNGSDTVFDQPFNELLVWSVLTKRQAMAKLMWQYGEETFAKALVAHNLYRAMAIEATNDDALELEKTELDKYSAEFGKEAYELLDYCYRQDSKAAQELLTSEMPNWSYQTCLCLAFTGHHCKLLSHPCAQLILGDLWLGGLRTRRQTKWKIFLSLVFPFCLFLNLFAPHHNPFSLEFKSKKEIERFYLQQAVDNFTQEGNYRCKRPLIKNRDVNNVENGTSAEPLLTNPPPVTDLNLSGWIEPGWKMKIVAFYVAPITKYMSWSIAYVIFLFIYTYTLLIRTPVKPEWNELYVIAYIATFAMEKVREIAAKEPVKCRHKFSAWICHRWNCFDTFFILLFFTGMTLRLQENTLDIGRVLYCLNIIYWYIRILVILRVSRFLGPFLTMIGQMLEKMMLYIILMLIILMSYGVFRQSLLFPNEEFSWLLVRDIFFKPYFMIYGELFADSIDPPCGNGTNLDGSFDPNMLPCVTGRWLNPLVMTAYLLVVSILMLNLLIAVFNSIFDRAAEYSERIWKYDLFAVVMEYQKKPPFPPPFVLVSHIYLFVKWIQRRKIRFQSKELPNQLIALLKLDPTCVAYQDYVNKFDLTSQYTFERKSVKGLASEREAQRRSKICDCALSQ